jgi:hypothetical protein
MRDKGVIALACVFTTLVLVAAPVLAQTPSPTPKGATVEGEVTGALEVGSTLTFSVDATMPGGWEALHLVEVVVRSGGQELERITYDIEDVQITVGGMKIVVGTGGVATGSHLRVSGADVVVTTGGGNLNFEVTADVLEPIPAGARFDLGVTDDFGESTSVTRQLAEPVSEGLTWETVLAFVAAALFIGAFIGNLFASKRRPPVRPSVYATVQRRLEQERAASGKSEA